MKKLLTALAISLGLLAATVPSAFAGTDLTVSCPNIGVCSVSPVSTPLFDEAGWYPSASVTQRLRVTNTSSQNGFVGVEVANYSETKNLGEIVEIEIHEGSPVGPLIYTGVTVHGFRDDGYFTIDGINSGQTIDYYFIATMPVTAGNQYQDSELIFDLNTGLEIAPIAPPSGAGDGTGTVLGTSTAQPPVCNAQPPSGAPSVTITNIGVNTVSLSWTPVSPVTHYALIFTRNSDGAQYGSTNIGNVTSYTINGVSGGAGYTFQIFGVNDCAPGSRGTAVSGIIPGPVLAARPTGPGGEVLGVEEDLEASPSPVASPTSAGLVAGATTQCVQWRYYIPLIFLLVQFLLILLIEYMRRHDGSILKLFLVVGVTLLSIGLFYWLRECDCYSHTFWSWLCKWYWLVSLLLTGLLRLISYAFIEDIED
jgi:hypothetical protein